jgi:hypothetical protein
MEVAKRVFVVAVIITAIAAALAAGTYIYFSATEGDATGVPASHAAASMKVANVRTNLPAW